MVPPVQYNQSNVWGGGGGGREEAVRTGVVLYGKYTEIIIASVQRNLECIVPLCNIHGINPVWRSKGVSFDQSIIFWVHWLDFSTC